MSVDFPLQIDGSALKRLETLFAKDGRPEAFFRVGVKGGGCSGLEYVLKIDTRTIAGDHAAVLHGLPFRCDPKSARYLEGTLLLYTGNLIGGGFRFDNPNAARKCGCGTSFTPKS